MTSQLLLTDFLDRAVHLYGNKKAIIDDAGNNYTYREVNERINQLSHGLEEIGITKGDRVAYLAPNTLEMYEGFYGIMQLGAIMVPLNIRLKPEEYKYILNHSESKVLFVDYELLHFIKPIINELKTIENIIVHGLGNDFDRFISYDNWLKNHSTLAFKRNVLDENDFCSLLYTSGTTGKPKGVILSHRNNYLHAMSAMHHLHVTDQDVLLHVLPMFHVNGWGSPFYYTANGATQVMLRKVDSKIILQKMKEYSVTVMHMAPTVLGSIINTHEKMQPTIKQDVRVVIAGAAPPKAFIKKIEEKIGWKFLHVYGMTETAPLSTTSYISSEDYDLTSDDYYRAKAKIGYEMIGSRVRVVNGDGEDVAKDGKEVGEIIVKGHGVMQGYWKDPHETGRIIKDGWLYTGDMGTMDDRRRIEVVDRKKDIIISGGENISSIEVEDIIFEHPAVNDCAVIPIAHKKWGETPHALVVLKDGYHITEEELIKFCRSRLAHFKCPSSVDFIKELPKTASGKVLKVQLKKTYT